MTGEDLRQNSHSSLSKKYLLCLLVALIAIVYLQTLKFDFTYDDTSRIKEEVLVTNKDPLLSSLLKIFTLPTFPGDLYRPLTTLAYKIQFTVFNGNPAGFHALSIFLHFFAALLGFLVLRCCGVSQVTAFLTTLLFAVHPINVESVASIAGQAELLSCCFGLFGLLSIKCLNKNIIKLIFSIIFFALSAFAKESGLIFPLLGIFLFRLEATSSNAKVSWLSCAVAFTIYLLSRAAVLGPNFFIERPKLFFAENPLLDLGVSGLQRILPALQNLGDYLRLLLLPIHLSLDYAKGFKFFWDRVYSFDGFLSATLTIAVIIWAIRSKDSKIQLGIGWFFISFIATCNLFFPIGTLMAERLCYTPALGFCLLLTHTITKTLPKIVGLGLISCLILALYLRTSTQVPLWQSDRVLLLEMANLAPDSPKAHFITGREYLVIHKDFDKAEVHLRQALELDPTRFGPMRELTNLSLQKGEYGRAEYWARKGLEILPEEPELNRILKELNKLKKQD